MRIAFLHPDLGIGGAERLVVDAAMALKSKNNEVTIVTAHHDKRHCFDETKNGDLRVYSVGDWLPTHFLGRAKALFANLRMIYLTFWLMMFSKINPDVVICDQVSAPLIFLRQFCSAKLIFYCHYPDKLLSPEGGLFKRWYRVPLDFLEEWSISFADLVFVNSHFTG